MKLRFMALTLAVSMLAACAVSGGSAKSARPGDLPEAVIAVAAPYQDLETARLRPEDGCYWYLHAGPVETTLIPLRTVDGRPICTRPQT